MDFRRRAIFVFVVVASAASSGCRHNAAQRELLERELRFQEDRIYELEAKLEEARRSLERAGLGRADCPPPSGSIRFESPGTAAPTFRDFDAAAPSVVLPGSSSGTTPSGSMPPSTGPLPPGGTLDVSPPKVELPGAPPIGTSPPVESAPPGSSAPPFRPPVMSPPDPNKPEGLPSSTPSSPSAVPPATATPPASSTPPTASPPAAPAPEKIPLKQMTSPKFISPAARATPRAVTPPPAAPIAPTTTAASSAPADAVPPPSAVAGPQDLRVESIALGRRTGGMQIDGNAGDDGLVIVVLPKNARGQTVEAAGAVSIAVIDPAVPGEGARYARLDFTADDAAAMFRPAVGGDEAGMYFEIPWPDQPPAHAQLRVFVRLTTDDGRRLEADREVTIRTGDATARQPAAPGLSYAPSTLSGGAPLQPVPPSPPPGEAGFVEGEAGPVLVGPSIMPAVGGSATGRWSNVVPAAPQGSIPTTAAGPTSDWKRRR